MFTDPSVALTVPLALTSRFQISVFNQPQRFAILRNASLAQNAWVIIELIELSALWMARPAG
jgi:hypothetical protein